MAAGFTDAAVEKYLYGILPKRDAVAAEMEKLAKKENIPIIGPAVARLLSLVAQLSGARRIFEMGSAIGYSTLWLARAMGPRGEIFYTDSGEQNIRRAGDFLKRGGVAQRVRFLQGDALKLLRATPGKFDIIFIDVDKYQYPASLKLALPRIRRGGLLIADNTLWSGKVAISASDRDTEGIREFNRQTFSSPKLFPVMVPLRDGVTICRKI
jgi:predicted O-methyltransferase YrrM